MKSILREALRFSACVLALLGCGAAVAKEGPVLLLGSGYGRHERAAFIAEVINPAGFAYESSDAWVDPSAWAQYSAVVVADESPQALKPENEAEIRAYLEGGGALIMTGTGLNSLAGVRSGKVPEWFPGYGGVNLEKTETLREYISTKDVKGILKEDRPLRGWGASPQVLVPATGEFQLGDKTQSIASLQPVGGGFVAYVGAPLFRVRNAAKSAAADARIAVLKKSASRTTDPEARKHLEKKLGDMERQREAALKDGPPDDKALARLLGNFLKVVSPPGTGLASASWLAANAGEPVIFWRRDPVIAKEVYTSAQRGVAPRWQPAQPIAAERTEGLVLRAGQDDLTSAFVNATATSKIDGLACEWKQDGDAAPCVEVLQAGGWGGEGKTSEAFWMRPASGSLDAGATTMLGLRVDTSGVPPGKYSGTLHLAWSGGEKSLPVEIDVLPVSFREDVALKLGFYGFNWLGSFPRSFPILGRGDISQTMEELLPVLANQRSLGAGGIVNGAANLKGTRVKGDSFTLAERLEKKDEDFSLLDEGGNVRELNFSGLDAQVEAARRLGFSRVNIRHGMAVFTQAASNYPALFSHSPHLSPRWSKVFVGIWKQFREYLAGKGFTEFTFKYGDELGAGTLEREWLPVSRLAREAGWLPETNPTGKAVTVEAMQSIQKVCESYSLNIHYLDEFLKWKKEGKVKLLPEAMITTYGSWGYYKSPPVLMRRTCWEIWAKGVAGLDVYTYAQLSAYDGETVYNPASAFGLMTGWRETSYLQQLSEAHAAAVKAGRGGEWAARVGKLLRSIREGGEGFPWQEERFDNVSVRSLAASTEQLDRKREEVLALLAAAPKVSP